MTHVADPRQVLDAQPERRLRSLQIPLEQGHFAGSPLQPAEVHHEAELARHLRPPVDERSSLHEPAAHRFQLGLKSIHLTAKGRIILVTSKKRLDSVDRFSGRR